MRKLFFILSVFATALVLSSCVSTKEVVPYDDSIRATTGNEVMEAVASRRFIIKLDRLYTYGRIFDLRPRANYIIVDGKRGIINAALFGRSYDIRPIAGINLRGTTSAYEVTNKVSRGRYVVKMRIENQNTAFDVYLNINKDGSADASVNSLRIDNTRYRGYVVPLNKNERQQLHDVEVI